jgi:hypothetical protein
MLMDNAKASELETSKLLLLVRKTGLIMIKLRHYFELKSSLDVFVLVMAHKKYIKGIDQRKTNDENDR